jgi:hypothetical protein
MGIAKAGLLGAAVAASVLVSLAPSASASTPIPCSDNMSLVPASTVPQGQQKDKNKNGLVCAKLGTDGQFHGGPDDNTIADDIVL